MIENKRFIAVDECVMQDNEVYVVCKGEHNADVVTTAMNELIEENEELKKENAMLKTTIARNEAYIERMKHKGEWRK